jgi:hypothetical protein
MQDVPSPPAAASSSASTSSSPSAAPDPCSPVTDLGPALSRLPFWRQGTNATAAELAAFFHESLDTSISKEEGSFWMRNGSLISVRGTPAQWVAYSSGRSPAATEAEAKAFVQRLLSALGLPVARAFHVWPDGEKPSWTLDWDEETPAGPRRMGTAHFSVAHDSSEGTHITLYPAFGNIPSTGRMNVTRARETAAAFAECRGFVNRSAWADPLREARVGFFQPEGTPERLAFEVRVSWGQDVPSRIVGVHGCPGPATFVTVDAITGAVLAWRNDRPLGCD